MARLELFANLNNFAVQTDNSVRIFTRREFIKVGFKPDRGSQVFVGRLPSDAYEDEIFEFFSGIGLIIQIKLILKLSGETKGFAFVTFIDAETASKAVATLNGKPMRPNNPIFVGISTNYCILLLKNAEGENASPQQIKKVFQKIAKTEVKVVNHSTFSIEFPEHHLAYRALKEFAVVKREIWGQSAKLLWENNFQPNEQINEQYRLSLRQLIDQERRENIARESYRVQLQSLQEDLLAARYRLNALGAEARQSPDSGIGSCRGSVGNLSPTHEAAAVPSPILADAAHSANFYLPEYKTGRIAPPLNPGNADNIITRYGSQAATAESSRLQSVRNAAVKIKNLIPKYMPTDNQALPFENSKFASAYCTAPADYETGHVASPPNNGNADNLVTRYGSQAATEESSRLQSVRNAAAKIKNLIPKYMPTDNQALPFENSKFASAYCTAPAEYETGHVAPPLNPGNADNLVTRYGSQAATEESSRLQSVRNAAAKIKNLIPKYMPTDNQALPFENSKFASAYCTAPAEYETGHVAPPLNPGNADNVVTRYGSQAATAESSRLQSVHNAEAKIKNLIPKYMPTDNQFLPFENFKFASAYCTAPAEYETGLIAPPPNNGNADNLVTRYGSQAATEESSRLQSVHNAEAKIKNLIPKYMPTDNQALPFENSKFASAYCTAPAEFETGHVASPPNNGNADNVVTRYGSQAATAESSRLQSVHNAAAKIKNLIPKYMPTDNQALPFENSKFASAYCTAPAEYETGRIAPPLNPGNADNDITRYGSQAATAESSRLQSVCNDAAKIKNLIPKYMPTDNQALPFENSKFASAYCTAPAEYETGRIAPPPNNGNADNDITRYGSQAATAESSRLQSVCNDAAKIKNLIPKYMPTDNQALPFENSKFASAYCTAPAEYETGRIAPPPNNGNADNLVTRYGSQAATEESSRLQSVHNAEAKIKNLIPKYMPTDNQALPFENSKFASAYCTAPAEFETGHVASPPNNGNTDNVVTRYGSQAATAESSRLQSVRNAAVQMKNLIPKYMPTDNQALPFENSKFASAYCTAPAGNSPPWPVVESVVSWALDDEVPEKPAVCCEMNQLNCTCAQVHFMRPRRGTPETPVFNSHVYATNNACWMPDLDE